MYLNVYEFVPYFITLKKGTLCTLPQYYMYIYIVFCQCLRVSEVVDLTVLIERQN